MMIHGRIDDNTPRRQIAQTFFGSSPDGPEIKAFCQKIAGKNLHDLSQDNPGLLVFPNEYSSVKDDLEQNCIFSVDGDSISTGNVMGFIGSRDVSLTISSRFHHDKSDYFLHYLLQKVNGYHIVDLPTPNDTDSVWADFLPYLFPSYFLAAWRQGAYKRTKRFACNDDRPRGTIDIARHIRGNIPFSGKIAYEFSEHSSNNSINQLLRLTISVLENDRRFMGIFNGKNSAFKDAVWELKQQVPIGSIQNKSRIIKENLRPIAHPYYRKYRPLQKLCLAILRHQKSTFGGKDEKVVGILFDGAWLWEEYIATIMPKNCGIIHARNKEGLFGIPALGNSWMWFPDFYRKEDSSARPSFVLDAKYKRYENGAVNSSDQHQIVSYMYVLRANVGGFVLAKEANESDSLDPPQLIGKLDGYGGSIKLFRLSIPTRSSDYRSFSVKMKKMETEFQNNIRHLCEATDC